MARKKRIREDMVQMVLRDTTPISDADVYDACNAGYWLYMGQIAKACGRKRHPDFERRVKRMLERGYLHTTTHEMANGVMATVYRAMPSKATQFTVNGEMSE